MSARVLVGNAQYLEPVDYERFGSLPQAALDDVVGDAIGYPAHWSGFTVSIRSAQEVEVSPGRYLAGRTVYAAEDTLTINLTTHIPVSSSDERWIAIIARGRVVEVKEDRAFDTSTDPETEQPVDQTVAVMEAREAYVTLQDGVAAPPPALKPAIAATDACIAFVRITTLGVQAVEPGEGWRARSLFEVEGRVTALEVKFSQVVARTEVLETGMSNANAAIDELRRAQIRPEIFREVRRDVAAMRRQLQVPAGARTSWYDPGLLLDQWDTKHPLWSARIDEGIQGRFEASREARLEVKNEDDPRIRFQKRRMMPVWDKVKRIFNEGGRGTRLISQLTHTEVEAIQRTVSRTKTSYGPTINVCENQAEWSRFAPQLQAGASFTKDNETFKTIGKVADNGVSHVVYAVQSVKKVNYTSTYWDYVTTTVGLNGSTYGQTFLVDQPLICPSIELEFAKVGPDGAVYVLFCETDDTGAPLVASIISSAVIEAKDLKVGWNEFVGDLTFFEPGKRYAWYAVTTGAHTIYGSEANAFGGGTSFRFTDGVWAQGDQTFDFNFRLNGCRFRNTRTVIDFKAMTIPAGGMTQFSLLHPSWAPEGTQLAWEIQPEFGGQEVPWSQLKEARGADNPLAGMPGTVNLRLTMIATPDLAPMIELSADAVYEVARVAPSFRAVSQKIDFGLSTNTIQTVDVIDDFDPAVHVFEPRIIVNEAAVLTVPNVITVKVDPDKPTRREITATYSVSGATSMRNCPGGRWASVTKVFFGQNTAAFAN